MARGTVEKLLNDPAWYDGLTLAERLATPVAVLDNTGVPHAQNAAQSQAILAHVDASNRAAGAVFVTYPAS